MPVAFRADGYRFFFYSNEGDPREPLHVHVRKGGALAKVWIEPEVRIAANYGFSHAEARAIERLVRDNEEQARRCWHDHFGA